jgi:hypothetical protein
MDPQMYDRSNIVLKKVKNGWIVKMPVVINPHSQELEEMMNISTNMLAKLHKKLDEDILLQNEEDMKEPNIQELLSSDIQSDLLIYVFYKFEEVLEFLRKIKMDY